MRLFSFFGKFCFAHERRERRQVVSIGGPETEKRATNPGGEPKRQESVVKKPVAFAGTDGTPEELNKLFQPVK